MSTVARSNMAIPTSHWTHVLALLSVTLAVLLAVAIRMPVEFLLLIIGVGTFALAALRVDVLLYSTVLFLPIPLSLPREYSVHDYTVVVRFMMFFGVCVRWLLDGRSFRRWLIGTRLNYLAIGYAVISLLSAVLFNQRTILEMAAPARLLSYLCFYFTVIGWVRTEQQTRRVIGLLLVSTIAVALFGFFQVAIGGYSDLYFWLYPKMKENLEFVLWTGRITSFLNHFNTLAGYLHLVLPFALACAVVRLSRNLRLVAICCLISATIALIMTQSRGGVFAYAGTLLVALLLLPRSTRNRKVIAVTVLLTILVSVPFVAQFSLRYSTMEDDSGLMRFAFWDVAWGMFQASPLIGIGYGNFVQQYDGYLPSLEPGRYDVHNLYLQLLAETGVLGFVLFMLLVAVALGAAWRQLHHAIGLVDRVVGFAALGALVSLLIHGFVDTLIDLPQCGSLFWMILALLVASDQLSDNRRLAMRPELA